MFDLQTLMAMLQSQGQQQGNPIMATGGQNGQWGGPMGQQMQAQPQMTGQNIGPQQQQAAQGGMSQALLNSGALGGLGMLSAGLQAGGPQPHPTSMGQVLGAGIKGLVGGAQQDQQMALQRQQQAALAQIAQKLGQSPMGAQPAAGGAQQPQTPPPSMVNLPQTQGSFGGGQTAQAALGQGQSQNPILSQLLMRRYGLI